MGMNDALRFIESCKNDSVFRAGAYDTSSPQEFRKWIYASGYSFQDSEIDDAFRTLKLKARDEDDAGEIGELSAWYQLMADRDSSCSSCTDCASKASCGK